HGLLRGIGDVGDQARPRCQRLGAPDPGPRRHVGPDRFGGVFGADLLSPDAVFFHAVTPWGSQICNWLPHGNVTRASTHCWYARPRAPIEIRAPVMRPVRPRRSSTARLRTHKPRETSAPAVSVRMW